MTEASIAALSPTIGQAAAAVTWAALGLPTTAVTAAPPHRRARADRLGLSPGR